MEQDVFENLDAGRTRQAFELVAVRYRDRIYRIALAVLGDEAAAEDAAQETLVRIWKGLPGFRRSSELKTWIYAIARNCALTLLAARKARPLEEFDEHSRVVSATAPERARHDVDAMVRNLRPQYQQVIRLFYMQEKSYEEVAAMLDLPLGTVKTALHRAKLELVAAAAQLTGKGVE